MLAADIFQSFKEEDLNNPEKQAIVGRKLVICNKNNIRKTLTRLLI